MQLDEWKALHAAHEAFIAAWLRSDGRTLAYYAPCCGEPIVTPAPKKPGQTWDSLAVCHHCGALHMKVVTFEAARGFIPSGLDRS